MEKSVTSDKPLLMFFMYSFTNKSIFLFRIQSCRLQEQWNAFLSIVGLIEKMDNLKLIFGDGDILMENSFGSCGLMYFPIGATCNSNCFFLKDKYFSVLKFSFSK